MRGELISLWLYKENNKLRVEKMYFLYIFPLSSTHLWLRCSNFFNSSKKNSFGCAANGKIGNRKSQRLLSAPTYLPLQSVFFYLSVALMCVCLHQYTLLFWHGFISKVQLRCYVNWSLHFDLGPPTSPLAIRTQEYCLHDDIVTCC
jgi:hypothetical protein